MAVSKFRIRFRKSGDLRFLSHHDLMRAFERILRRAQLPFKSTEGFHPKPKMAFASALALGIVGSQEVIEIEFNEELAPEDVRRRLAEQVLPGLEIQSVRPIEPRQKAMATRAGYRLELTPDEQLQDRVDQLLAQDEIWMQREKPQPRRVNLRPYVHRIELGATELYLEFIVTPNGTARPEEVLRLLGLELLLHEGAVLERVFLEIADEIPSIVPGPLSMGQMDPRDVSESETLDTATLPRDSETSEAAPVVQYTTDD